MYQQQNIAHAVPTNAVPTHAVQTHAVPTYAMPTSNQSVMESSIPTQILYQRQKAKVNARVALALGITQIVFGLLFMICGILILLAVSMVYFIDIIATGIWYGLMIAIAGTLCVVSAVKPYNRCLNGTNMGFASLSCFLSAVATALFALGIITYNSCSYSYNFYGCYNGSLGLALYSLSFCLAIAEFSIALTVAVFCCKFSCTNGCCNPTSTGISETSPNFHVNSSGQQQTVLLSNGSIQASPYSIVNPSQQNVELTQQPLATMHGDTSTQIVSPQTATSTSSLVNNKVNVTSQNSDVLSKAPESTETNSSNNVFSSDQPNTREATEMIQLDTVTPQESARKVSNTIHVDEEPKPSFNYNKL